MNRLDFLKQQGATFAERKATIRQLLFVRLVLVLLMGALCALASAADPIVQKKQAGPVSTTIRLEPARPKIGDVVTLTIEVVSKKDVEVLMPEFGEALERFTIIDFVPRQSIDNRGQTVATQKYRLQSPYSGKQSIPPILIEFVDHREGERESPEGLDAFEILTERIDFEVESVVPRDAASELKPPLGRLQDRETSQQSLIVWAIGGVVVFALCCLAGAVITFALLSKKTRRRSAYEIARLKLDQLLASRSQAAEHAGQFFVDLSGIVRNYLENRFDFRAPELTTEEFMASVSGSPDLATSHQTLLRDFLKLADLVKFAGVHPSESDIQNSIAAAERFLEETRENSPLIESDDAIEASRKSGSTETAHSSTTIDSSSIELSNSESLQSESSRNVKSTREREANDV